MRIAAPGMKSLVCAHGVEVWEPLPQLRRPRSKINPDHHSDGKYREPRFTASADSARAGPRAALGARPEFEALAARIAS